MTREILTIRAMDDVVAMSMRGRRAVCSVAWQVQYSTVSTCVLSPWVITNRLKRAISSSHSAFIRWTLDFKYIRRNILEERVFQLLCFNNIAMSLLFEIESLVHIFYILNDPLVLCAIFLQNPNQELFLLFCFETVNTAVKVANS